MIAKFTSIRVRVIFFILLFITSVSILDTLVFYKLAYSFPNEMEWDTSHWYNFQYSRTNMNPFPEERKGVLVVGSSVALYSALPNAMEESLEKEGKKTSVRFYSHVAMSPSDFYSYTEDIISKNPKLVIYLLNPGDFQLDYFPSDDSIPFEFDLSRWIKGNAERQPVRSFYPFDFVIQNYKEMNRESLFLLLTKSMLYVNRERSFILDPFYAYYEKHFRSGRSYHNYTGITPNEGIWRKGWTFPKFSIVCEKPEGTFRKEFIYIHHPNTKVRVSVNQQELLSLTFSSSGWKEIQIPFETNVSTMKLLIEADPTVSSRIIDPKSYAREEFYGIRLSQNFCRNEYQKNIALDRRESLEDISISNMSLEEYQADYTNKLLYNSKKRPELYRQNHIREVKIKLSKTEFTPWIEFDHLRKGLLKLKQKNIKIILVTNPENPLETRNYVPSRWYSGYDEYMRKISHESNSLYIDKILFFKDPRNFLDVNHLTYSGAERMSKEYVNLIQETLHE
jgi:hypothetical protein